jgi:hypothetical protein
MSRRQEVGGNHPAGALLALRGQHELRYPLPSRSLTFSEPLEPMKIGDAPLDVRMMLRNLLLMLFMSIALLGLGFVVCLGKSLIESL